MKYLKQTILIFSIFLVSCGDSPKSQEAIVSKNTKIDLGSDGSFSIREVTIDGNVYYATRSYYGYWHLCPKLPPKAENQTPQ